MAHFDYISELKSSSLTVHDDGTMPSYSEVDSYLSDIEQTRQEFLSFIASKEKSVIKAYLCELKEADKKITQRGFIHLPDLSVVDAVLGNIEDAQSILILKKIDSQLHLSAQSTISFIKSLLGETETEPVKGSEVVESNKQDDVIRGVKGLSEFLKIGTTKAQAIINSKILTKTKPAIQYYAGAWLFNRERLQDFITKNPEAFRDIKCPH